MAERRMFAKTIIDSDAFLDMPLSTQCLYMHLSMRADDDGFINNPKKIQRMIGASDDDLKVLIAKNFIIPFESGIVVIKHWRIHNYIRGDRKHSTVYSEEFSMLDVKENGAYSMPTKCQSTDRQLTVNRYTEDSIGKNRIDKESIGEDSIDTFAPSLESSEPAIISLTLNTGEKYPITQEDIENFKKLYPAVDVLQQFRNMCGWLDANPTKRKTRSGIKRFVNTWLAREQNDYHPGKQTQQSRYDAIAAWANERSSE